MIKFVLTILAVFACTALLWGALYLHGQTKTHSREDRSFFTERVEVIAHRGGALEAPENTLIAFDHAVAISPDIVFELDVHWTKDKKIVAHHDFTLDRTTNGTGPIKEKTLAELKELDAGYFFKNEQGEFNFRGKKTQIPTLEEIFEKYPKTRMIVEIKPSSSDFAKDVLDLIQKYQRHEITIVGTEHGNVIKYLRSLDDKLITAASKDENLRTVMLLNMRLGSLDKMPGNVLCVPEKHSGVQVLTASLLEEAKKRNKKVYVWTVNESEDMKSLIELGVNGIITDRPKALESLINTLH